MSSTVMRWFGNGQSNLSDPAEAGAEAVRAALQGRRPAEYDFRIEFREQVNIRPGHAAVSDIADNGDP